MRSRSFKNVGSSSGFSLAVALLLTATLLLRCAPFSFASNQPAGTSALFAETRRDWSVAVVESTMKRFPTADSLKGWGYQKSLYLYGVYLVYLRTHEKRYLDYIRSWVDLHVDDKGAINRPINAEVFVLPANLLLILYQETKQGEVQARGRQRAQSIRYLALYERRRVLVQPGTAVAVVGGRRVYGVPISDSLRRVIW